MTNFKFGALYAICCFFEKPFRDHNKFFLQTYFKQRSVYSYEKLDISLILNNSSSH